MRLTPDSIKVDSYPTTDLPADKVGHASSDTDWRECSGLCIAATCIYEVCG